MSEEEKMAESRHNNDNIKHLEGSGAAAASESPEANNSLERRNTFLTVPNLED